MMKNDCEGGVETIPEERPKIDPQEEFLRNPPPGSAAARARDFGVDLTLTIENLRLTPEQRIRQLDRLLDGINRLKATARLTARDDRD